MFKKNELTAKWWQYFLNDVSAPENVHFVKSRMVRPHHNEINKTHDLVQSSLVVVPVNNWISLVRHDTLRNKAMMIKTAKERMDSVILTRVKINGQDITPERIMSTFFNITINQKNLLYDFPQQLQLGRLEPGEYIALSDGYWLFLKELGVGEYKIETSSSCATGVFALNMQYDLVVSTTSHDSIIGINTNKR